MDICPFSTCHNLPSIGDFTYTVLQIMLKQFMLCMNVLLLCGTVKLVKTGPPREGSVPLTPNFYLYFFFSLICTRFTISCHTLPPIKVDHADSHNFLLGMVHKQACMAVRIVCNYTVVFGRQLCNYNGPYAGGFLGPQFCWS